MPERHTVDFARGSIGVVSDDRSGTVTLQFNPTWERTGFIDAALEAIRARFGPGVAARLARWRAGDRSPFILPPTPIPHPDAPDVLCFTMVVAPGERLESALAALFDVLRRQPGYQRTIGAPLDPDLQISEARPGPTRDLSDAATAVLQDMLKRRRRWPTT